MALAKCSLWWPSHVCSSVGPGMVRSCGGPRMCSRVVNLACVRVWWPWHGVLVCCGALVWWTCHVLWRPSHVFARGGPGMVLPCGSHPGVFGGRSGAIRGHSGVRGHVVSSQGPLGGQSGLCTRHSYHVPHSPYPTAYTPYPMPHVTIPHT